MNNRLINNWPLWACHVEYTFHDVEDGHFDMDTGAYIERRVMTYTWQEVMYVRARKMKKAKATVKLFASLNYTQVKFIKVGRVA